MAWSDMGPEGQICQYCQWQFKSRSKTEGGNQSCQLAGAQRAASLDDSWMHHLIMEDTGERKCTVFASGYWVISFLT